MNLGLYLHIPYCLHKCGYCDFNSHPENQKESIRYVDALLKELGAYSSKKYTVTKVFIWVGTPTILLPSQLKQILDRVGLGKKEQLDINAKVSHGIFILPPQDDIINATATVSDQEA